MEHPGPIHLAGPGGEKSSEGVQHIAVSLPIMEDHRQGQLPRQFELAAEPAELDIPGTGVFIMIIEADLPDGYRLWMDGHRPDFGKIRVGHGGSLLRMHPDGGKEAGEPFGKPQAFPGRGHRTAGVHNPRHGTCLIGTEQAGEQCVPVGIECRIVIVCVRIENRGMGSTPLEMG